MQCAERRIAMWHCLKSWGLARRMMWLLCGLMLLSVGAQAAEPAPLALRIVGGLGGVRQYTELEAPFWRDSLPELTQGRVQAEIVPFDRAGIRGQDMLRLMQLGVVPFGTAVVGLSATQEPLLAAPDLPGLNADMAALRRSLAAFRPALAQMLQQRYGLELLAVYAYPAQVLFCRRPFRRLGDLAQRRVRVSSVSQADLVDGLGATAVYLPFAELAAQLRGGQIDCAITGTMSGHTLGLDRQRLATHISPQPINWGLSLFAANAAAWAALPASLRELLQRELPALEARIWAQAERESGEGLACNTGAPGCSSTQAGGGMRLVPPDAGDAQRLRQLAAEVVLPRWAQRCGPDCSRIWAQTVGPVSGMGLPGRPRTEYRKAQAEGAPASLRPAATQ